MNQEPYQPFDDAEDESSNPLSRRRRDGFAVDLTGIQFRVALTAVALGLSLLLVYCAVRPGSNEQPLEPIPPVEAGVGETNPESLATFTPGPTSTPPPLDEPTPGPTQAVAPVAGQLTLGGPASVANTGGSGVNMRAGPGTANEVIEVLADATPLTLLEGPQEAEGFNWWRVRLESGTEGWLVQDFIAAP